MKQTYFRKFTSSIIAGALLLSIVGTPVSVFAQAQAQTPSEQLESLAASLKLIGSLIASSTTLTDADRLALMVQLVTISSQILQLRQGDYQTAYNAYLNPAPLSDSTKESAEDAGLTRVKVAYDYETNEAVAEIFYGTRVENATYTFTELSSVSSFEQRISDLRGLIATRISNDTNIKQADIRQLMHVSGRDPLRDSVISQNSTTANYLLDKFGTHSIVDSVEVRPGEGSGSIIIRSDQGESLVLTLTEEVDSDGYTYTPGQYRYSYEFFAPSVFNLISISALDDDNEPRPVVSQVTNNVSETQIKRYISTLFNSVPFTSEIADFEGKMLKFLTENTAYYETTYTTVEDDDLDCYYASDKVVVDEFIEYLVSGVAVQYEDIATIKHYIAPFANNMDSLYTTGCRGKTRMF